MTVTAPHQTNVRANPRHISPTTLIIASSLLIFCSFSLFVRIPRLNLDNDWDMLIFTQRWPNTVCMIWEEQGPSHKCSLPKTHNLWTIHGIWPSKFGHFGPQFCNKSAAFNASALDDIRDELNEYWKDIESTGGNAFWKHEWLKHGTCAMTDQLLSTERSYFEHGLSWSKKYNIIDILDAASITPGDNNQAYNVSVIEEAVQKATGKIPRIQCVHDAKTGLQYLFEVRLCFDKNLTLVDCNPPNFRENNWLYGSNWHESNFATNCPLRKPVMYPGSVPSPKRRRALFEDPEHILVTTYKTLKLLFLVTL